MRSAAGALVTFLEGNEVAVIADLLTITTAAAVVYRWTNYDQDITTGGYTWTAGGTGTAPIVGRGSIRETVGLDPSDLDITLGCGDSAELGGVALTAAVVAGALDGATVQLDRCYMSSPGTVVGTLLRFSGRVSSVTPNTTSVRVMVRSHLEDLNQVLPRNLYRPLCIHAVFDAGCGLTRASYAYNGAVTGSPTTTVFTSTPATGGADYFTGGLITFTSGTLNGESRMIRQFNNGSMAFTVDPPFEVAPAVSDTFTAYPGCDKTAATCTSKFSNANRRRGFDFVPTPEVVKV